MTVKVVRLLPFLNKIFRMI